MASLDIADKGNALVVDFIRTTVQTVRHQDLIHSLFCRYESTKTAVERRLVRALKEFYPQITDDKIKHISSGTPLSSNFFLGTNYGEVMGLYLSIYCSELHNQPFGYFDRFMDSPITAIDLMKNLIGYCVPNNQLKVYT